MRSALALGSICWTLLSQGQVHFDKDVLRTIACSEGRAHAAHQKAAASEPTRGYDLKYHRLDLEVDPAVRAISGSVTHYFAALTDLDEVIFDLSTDLVVSNVTHVGAPLTFQQANDLLTVQLPTTLATGSLDSLSIIYGGVPPETGFGSFVQTDHAGVPILWTLSEPYGARDWWPCKQDLNDKADSLDVIVTVPTGQRVAGNGLLIAQTDMGDGTTRHHWRHRHTINYYLVAFAVTNYTVYSDFVTLPGSTVEVQNYVFPENLFDAQVGTGNIVQQMQLFSELFGEYPFADEKYGHAQFGWGGGMEHQTMTFVGGFSYELLAHELGHQWFGDLVTCGSWEDLWLNEGWATYVTVLCYEHLAPQYWIPVLDARRDLIVSQPGGSVLVTDTLSIPRLFDSRLTYMKGSFVLHMLRWVCGDVAFYQGVNNYLNDPDIRNASALTPQFIMHLENTSGLDLDPFMADWYVGEGFPSYQVMWSQTASGEVSVQLDQTTSHPSVDFYEMPVPIKFKNSTMDSTMVLDHMVSGQIFTFTLPFQADSALFDPEIWILSGQNLVLKVPVAAFSNDALLLYPDPAIEQAWIYVGTAVQGVVDLDVYDGTGRLVRSLQTTVHGLRVELPCEGLGSGCYTVRLRAGESSFDLRFVKS